MAEAYDPVSETARLYAIRKAMNEADTADVTIKHDPIRGAREDDENVSYGAQGEIRIYHHRPAPSATAEEADLRRMLEGTDRGKELLASINKAFETTKGSANRQDYLNRLFSGANGAYKFGKVDKNGVNRDQDFIKDYRTKAWEGAIDRLDQATQVEDLKITPAPSSQAGTARERSRSTIPAEEVENTSLLSGALDPQKGTYQLAHQLYTRAENFEAKGDAVSVQKAETLNNLADSIMAALAEIDPEVLKEVASSGTATA